MPEDIETVFANEQIPLFPTRSEDLVTECSCPDWSNPCKHIAAVYYLLGAEFDRDPFLIFRLRVMERAELVVMLTARGAAAEPAVDLPEEVATIAPPATEPLVTNPDSFWGGEALPDDSWGEVTAPAIPAALPKSLGPFPFWRGRDPFPASLAAGYAKASQLIIPRLFG